MAEFIFRTADLWAESEVGLHFAIPALQDPAIKSLAAKHPIVHQLALAHDMNQGQEFSLLVTIRCGGDHVYWYPDMSQLVLLRLQIEAVIAEAAKHRLIGIVKPPVNPKAQDDDVDVPF